MLSCGILFGFLLQDDYLFNTGIPFIVLMIFPILTGIIKIADYNKESNICPNCNHKPMLSMNTPEAIKIIKDYDLEAGVNTAPDTLKEQKTSSSSKTPEP